MKNLFVILSFAAISWSCNDDENHRKDISLVGEYLFNGNTLDTSGKDHHGFNYGAILTTDRKNNPNSAYSFEGSQYISIKHNSDANFSYNQNFSISLWVLINTAQNTDTNVNYIFGKRDGEAGGFPYAISYFNSSTTTRAKGTIQYVRHDGFCSNVSYSYSPVVLTDVFHHIVLVKKGIMLRQYLDNALVKDFDDYSSCKTENTTDITIGANGNLVSFFSGKIDDIKIYNRALSDAEISSLFEE